MKDKSVVHSDPKIMSGTPVFVGTRVPVQTLLDYLEAGQPLSEFLEDFRPCPKSKLSPHLSRRKPPSSLVRVLLDECVPRRLKHELVGHDVRTAPEMGWASKRNGELLRLAEREFDAFLTVDRKLQHQQNLSTFPIAIIVMLARTNTLLDLTTDP